MQVTSRTANVIPAYSSLKRYHLTSLPKASRFAQSPSACR